MILEVFSKEEWIRVFFEMRGKYPKIGIIEAIQKNQQGYNILTTGIILSFISDNNIVNYIEMVGSCLLESETEQKEIRSIVESKIKEIKNLASKNGIELNDGIWKQ
ncbi:MAG: hypothetical protein QXD48_03840 [Candidatus Aenigmatarchaeota archaeon]